MAAPQQPSAPEEGSQAHLTFPMLDLNSSPQRSLPETSNMRGQHSRLVHEAPSSLEDSAYEILDGSSTSDADDDATTASLTSHTPDDISSIADTDYEQSDDEEGEHTDQEDLVEATSGAIDSLLAPRMGSDSEVTTRPDGHSTNASSIFFDVPKPATDGDNVAVSYDLHTFEAPNMPEPMLKYQEPRLKLTIRSTLSADYFSRGSLRVLYVGPAQQKEALLSKLQIAQHAGRHRASTVVDLHATSVTTRRRVSSLKYRYWSREGSHFLTADDGRAVTFKHLDWSFDVIVLCFSSPEVYPGAPSQEDLTEILSTYGKSVPVLAVAITPLKDFDVQACDMGGKKLCMALEVPSNNGHENKIVGKWPVSVSTFLDIEDVHLNKHIQALVPPDYFDLLCGKLSHLATSIQAQADTLKPGLSQTLTERKIRAKEAISNTCRRWREDAAQAISSRRIRRAMLIICTILLGLFASSLGPYLTSYSAQPQRAIIQNGTASRTPTVSPVLVVTASSTATHGWQMPFKKAQMSETPIPLSLPGKLAVDDQGSKPDTSYRRVLKKPKEENVKSTKNSRQSRSTQKRSEDLPKTTKASEQTGLDVLKAFQDRVRSAEDFISKQLSLWTPDHMAGGMGNTTALRKVQTANRKITQSLRDCAKMLRRRPFPGQASTVATNDFVRQSKAALDALSLQVQELNSLVLKQYKRVCNTVRLPKSVKNAPILKEKAPVTKAKRNAEALWKNMQKQAETRANLVTELMRSHHKWAAELVEKAKAAHAEAQCKAVRQEKKTEWRAKEQAAGKRADRRQAKQRHSMKDTVAPSCHNKYKAKSGGCEKA